MLRNEILYILSNSRIEIGIAMLKMCLKVSHCQFESSSLNKVSINLEYHFGFAD